MKKIPKKRSTRALTFRAVASLTGIKQPPPHDIRLFIYLLPNPKFQNNTYWSYSTMYVYIIGLFTLNCSDNFPVSCHIARRNLCKHFRDFPTLSFGYEKLPHRIIIFPILIVLPFCNLFHFHLIWYFRLVQIMK